MVFVHVVLLAVVVISGLLYEIIKGWNPVAKEKQSIYHHDIEKSYLLLEALYKKVRCAYCF